MGGGNEEKGHDLANEDGRTSGGEGGAGCVLNPHSQRVTDETCFNFS